MRRERDTSLLFSPPLLLLLLLHFCVDPPQISSRLFADFMSSIAETAVSCQAGNKSQLLNWILICLFPRFLGSPVAFVNFFLFKAIVRCPSSSICILESSREILP